MATDGKQPELTEQQQQWVADYANMLQAIDPEWCPFVTEAFLSRRDPEYDATYDPREGYTNAQIQALIAADWMEERGFLERAAFIRHQVDPGKHPLPEDITKEIWKTQRPGEPQDGWKKQGAETIEQLWIEAYGARWLDQDGFPQLWVEAYGAKRLDPDGFPQEFRGGERSRYSLIWKNGFPQPCCELDSHDLDSNILIYDRTNRDHLSREAQHLGALGYRAAYYYIPPEITGDITIPEGLCVSIKAVDANIISLTCPTGHHEDNVQAWYCHNLTSFHLQRGYCRSVMAESCSKLEIISVADDFNGTIAIRGDNNMQTLELGDDSINLREGMENARKQILALVTQGRMPNFKGIDISRVHNDRTFNITEEEIAAARTEGKKAREEAAIANDGPDNLEDARDAHGTELSRE